MYQQQTQNVEQASQQLTDSARQSFQMLADRAVGLQESNLRLAQDIFRSFVEQLQSQTGGNREATRNLQEQSQRQQAAFETLSQEATNAYSEFLDSTLSFYQEALNTASRVALGHGQVSPDQAVQQTVQSWDESEHQRDAGGRFTRGTEAWDESEHQRDAGGRFT